MPSIILEKGKHEHQHAGGESIDSRRGCGDERGISYRFLLHVMPINFMFTFFLTWVREGRHHPFISNAQDVQERAIPIESPQGTGEKGGTVMTE